MTVDNDSPIARERTAERVTAALRRVRSAARDEDLVEAGQVRGVRVDANGAAAFELVLAPEDPAELAAAARDAAAAVEGVTAVEVEVVTAAADPSPRPERASGRKELPIIGRPGPQGGHRRAGAAGARTTGPGGAEAREAGAHGLPSGSPGPRAAAGDERAASRHPSEAPRMEGVGRVIAVSSGKGGVGKSTVAVNLAAAWAAGGHRIGLMDADVYGPDVPTMFGVHEKPRMSGERVIPLEAHGVKLMSIGFLIDEDTPAIWRGPIVMGIVRQFLQQVAWGELDYLVVDLPPGTGDAQLSLCQLVRVDGAVMVTTPQDVAVGGVLKGIRMFQKVDVPVLGVIENMRGFACPECGHTHEIFGSGGGEKLAAALDVPFLGAVPLGMAVREAGDRGVPTAAGSPDSPEGRAFRDVAEAVAAGLGAGVGAGP